MDLVEVLRAIRDLEVEIAEWRTKNSQSNPGAMMDLRDMKKQLAAHQASYKKLIEAAAKDKKVSADK
jgi:hypothetical protein